MCWNQINLVASENHLCRSGLLVLLVQGELGSVTPKITSAIIFLFEKIRQALKESNIEILNRSNGKGTQKRDMEKGQPGLNSVQ
jgi:hypothetical protein